MVDSNFSNEKELERYFQQLLKVGQILHKVYAQHTRNGHSEAKVVLSMVDKFLYTMELLRMKYMYQDHRKPDILGDSGFFHNMELHHLAVDFTLKSEKLIQFDTKDVLRHRMIDFILKEKEPPTHLRKQMSQRYFYEGLDENKLFFPYNPGKLEFIEEVNYNQKYLYSWATYDEDHSVPFVYIMTFELDVTKGESFENPEFFKRFNTILKNVTSHSSKLNIICSRIDESLESVQPKIVKRVKFGPLYSNPFSSDLPPSLLRLFRHGNEGEQFVLFIENEYVFSEQQIVQRKNWLSGDQIRQIFFVDEQHVEFFERGVSRLFKEVIMPYRLNQHSQGIELLEGYDIISFDKSGRVYGLDQLSH